MSGPKAKVAKRHGKAKVKDKASFLETELINTHHWHQPDQAILKFPNSRLMCDDAENCSETDSPFGLGRSRSRGNAIYTAPVAVQLWNIQPSYNVSND